MTGEAPSRSRFCLHLKRFFGERFTFLFITSDDSHDEVTSLLAGSDIAICVLKRLNDLIVELSEFQRGFLPRERPRTL